MKFPIYGERRNVPNHQPDYDVGVVFQKWSYRYKLIIQKMINESHLQAVISCVSLNDHAESCR